MAADTNRRANGARRRRANPFGGASPARGLLWLALPICWLGLAGAIRGWAHQSPDAPVPSVRALKVEAPLKVDGVLDEPFWERVEAATDFIDQRTHQRADQQTKVRVAYTATDLYLAVECFDDQMSLLRASERREDRAFEGDDWVEIHLDPMHSHRNKYAFFSNPLGTRSDANEGPSGVFNRGWTAEWQLAARIREDRWVFEMRLPLGVMNFARKNGQTWGFNVTRVVRHSDTTSFWSFNPTDTYKPRHFGHLTGLDLADAQFNRNLEITPYVSTRVDFNGETHTLFQTGVDLNVRLTPSINTAWTINPDFGQVEADADTIELRDTERFLPEKRLFFREGEELMSMPYLLYYSRRFTDIDGGVKGAGQVNGLSFSVLDILGDTAHDSTRYGNSAVVRVLQNVHERSTTGYYLADSELEDGHSRVLSADGYYFLSDAWRYRFQLSGADDRREPVPGEAGKDRQDYLAYSSVIYDLYPWEFALGYRAISEDFNPTLGYVPRRDIFGPSFLADYYHESKDRWYKNVHLMYETAFYENGGGDTVLRDHSGLGRVVFPNDLGLRLGHDEDYHRPYDNRRTSLGGSIYTSDYWRYWGLGYALGTFETVDYHEFSLEKNLKPFERWPIRYEFVIRLEDAPPGNPDTVWLNRVVFDYYFTDKMWLKTSLQHRHDSVHNLSVIYGWEFRRRTHFYLVFNSVAEEGEDEGESVFSKITYTF